MGKLKALIAHFIWSGLMGKRKIHLVAMEAINIPKEFGEWVLINIKVFNNALWTESLWSGTNGQGTW